MFELSLTCVTRRSTDIDPTFCVARKANWMPSTGRLVRPADFRRAIHDPAVVHAMLEDYRAGLGIDRDDAGHHMAEEVPNELAALLHAFLSGEPACE